MKFSIKILKKNQQKNIKKESLLSKIKKKIKKGIENIVFSNNLKHYLFRYQQIQAIPQRLNTLKLLK